MYLFRPLKFSDLSDIARQRCGARVRIRTSDIGNFRHAKHIYGLRGLSASPHKELADILSDPSNGIVWRGERRCATLQGMSHIMVRTRGACIGYIIYKLSGWL